MRVTAADKRLLNDFQRDFPLEPRPFARIAETLGVAEDEVLTRLADLRDRGMVSRVGAVIRPNTIGTSTLAGAVIQPNTIGTSTLAAMAVPPERLDEVATVVNAEAAVNHNYEREHEINLWFVVTAADATGLQEVLKRIERRTGLPVLDLPLEEAFHIDLGFQLT
ncbi:MAG: Lrp/AsnC family transcriptional regulator [Rhodospirillales bacterium]|nr:Lrp/AsnC family transcriptional regulator [Rhodospirillales bacterium]